MFCKHLILCALIITSITDCTKVQVTKPYSYLNLRVEGQEDDIRWETIIGTWTDSLGNADLEATSYYFDRCNIHIKSITSLGNINPLTLMQFNYTDGIDLQPNAVSGTVTITQADDMAIRGKFNLYFDNNYNGVSGRRITGDFGIVNKP